MEEVRKKDKMEEMIDEIIKTVQDVGIYGSIMAIILVMGFKYLPKIIELKLKRAEEKDFWIESMKSVITNNTQVISNNSEVVKLNSTTIKNYTDNAHKLEDKIDNLTKVVQDTNKNVEILKEKGR